MTENASQEPDRRTNEGRLVRIYRSLRIRVVNAIAIVLSAILALLATVTVDHILQAELASEHDDVAYRACMEAARDLQEASDYLTSQARVYVVTGNREHLDAYMEELEVVNRRGRAVETLRGYLGDSGDAVVDLEEALQYSNELSVRELYAMRLTAEATGLSDLPPMVSQVALDDADAALDPAEQRVKAEQMVLGEEYQSIKDQINVAVSSCSDWLLRQLNEQSETSNRDLRTWLNRMQAVIILLLGIVVLVIFAVIFLILWPLAAYTQEVRNGEPLTRMGSAEMRYMADAYNLILAENQARTRNLQRAAERDHLTGLFNRGAYDQLLRTHTHNVALLLVDVDFFKEVNDGHGHDVGDAVLKKVARSLEQSFRASDLPCRIGGDEFAVIMTDVTPELREVVARKVQTVSNALRDTSDGLPPVTVSVGIVFSEAHPGEEELFKAADQALYVVKERGRDGYAFYDEVVAGEVAHD